MGFQVFVWTIAAVLIISAMGVVLSKNLVHSVFWLAATLIATAAMYVMLEAPFLAGIQIVLYAGGVITLMLFGVMLTQRNADTDIPNPMARPLSAGLAAALTLAVLLSGIWGSPELAKLTPGKSTDAVAVGQMFLREQLIAFEVLSVLLLAAMIGAIVLVRKADP